MFQIEDGNLQRLVAALDNIQIGIEQFGESEVVEFKKYWRLWRLQQRMSKDILAAKMALKPTYTPKKNASTKDVTQ